MLIKSLAAIAALTFAANVAAMKPYKPSMMKTSERELFGVVRRQDTPGYQPGQAMCGAGATCEEACGAGYTTCASTDNQVHCFNPTVGEVCCPDKSGNSCEKGYYCTADSKGETWCCPDGMDVAACAAAYSITDGLVSQTAPATSTSTSTSTSSSTTSAPSTTTTSSSSSTEKSTTTSVGSFLPTSFLPTSSFVPTNTTSISSVRTPTPSTSSIAEGAGNVVGAANGFALLAAGLAALL
ncbi:hypothetical protein N657DRAFT_670121 [Parathielavia appendiculata]|uniref:Uncharacterized protein n=1 Tax=Parathielavia appendiculata TaxID=2587402 RepID=A0AAN6U403_9PEZI|nr:hypothetical protein N657DRAFT_670121 [Parathielavia appendiculata]